MTLNVRIGGALSDFVATNIGDQGAYENVSEYVRDLRDWINDHAVYRRKLSSERRLFDLSYFRADESRISTAALCNFDAFQS